MTCTILGLTALGPRGHLKWNRRQNSVQIEKTLHTYFSYASSSSTQKQWRSAMLLTFCFSMAKYSRSEGGRRGVLGRKKDLKKINDHLRPAVHQSAVQSNALLSFPRKPMPIYSFYSPLMNSMHFDDTSSAVMLPTAENMLCKETHESALLHDVSRILR